MTDKKVTPDLLQSSVLAVPPLARKADYSLDREANKRLLEHLAGGGVTTAIYGGNANLYNFGVRDLEDLCDQLDDITPAGSYIIPSVGPDYGKSLEQLSMLKSRGTRTAMVLPMTFPVTTDGVATGLRRMADHFGQPLIAYIKSTGYLKPSDLGALIDDGVLCAIKYAVIRENPKDDPFLSELLQHVPGKLIVSGIGERPAIVHLRDFGLQSFTSGAVCIAPGMSTALLRAIKAGNWTEAENLHAKFMPVEDLRDDHSPLRVLHAAVGTSGVADMGAIYPFLSPIDQPKVLEAIERESRKLLQLERGYQPLQLV